MRINLALKTLLLAASLGVPALVSAQSLTGVVTDSAGTPIPAAEITLLETGRLASTNAVGRFVFPAVTGGVHLVRVRRIGYGPRLFRLTLKLGEAWDETIVLSNVPALLPDLVTTAPVPQPRFNLRAALYVDQQHYAPRTKFEIPYSTYGAVVVTGPTQSDAVVFFDVPEGHLPVGMEWGVPGQWDHAGAGAPTCRTSAPVVAGRFFGEEGSLLLLDVDGQLYLTPRRRVGREPSCGALGHLTVAGRVTQAAVSPGGWAVVSDSGVTSMTLAGYDLNGTLRWDLPLRGWGSPEDLSLAHLSGGTGSVTLAAPRWPFRWLEVDTNGTIRRESSPFMGLDKAQGVPADSLAYQDWRALGVIPLMDGWIQTLVRSDFTDRVLVLYDRVGRARTLTRLEGAPLLLAGDPDHRSLIGIRPARPGRHDGELVAYVY